MHMKYAICELLALVLTTVFVGCGPDGPKWSEDYAGELKKAAEDHGLMLVLLDGPGWNKPSDELHRNVLKKPEFTDLVKKNQLRLVEVVIPDPRGKGVKPAEADRLQEIVMRYHVHAYPTLALADGTGFPFVSFSSTDLKQVVSTLNQAVQKQKDFSAKMAEAETAQGGKRLELLMQAREVLPEERRDAYPRLIDTIIKNDPEDKAGFRKRIAETKQIQEQSKLFNEKLTEKLGDVAKLSREEAVQRLRAGVLELLKDDSWPPVIRQYFYQVMVVSYLQENKLKEALPYLQQAVDANPQSPEAEILRREYKRLSAESAKKEQKSKGGASVPVEKKPAEQETAPAHR